jgi:hypothetical protein
MRQLRAPTTHRHTPADIAGYYVVVRDMVRVKDTIVETFSPDRYLDARTLRDRLSTTNIIDIAVVRVEVFYSCGCRSVDNSP